MGLGKLSIWIRYEPNVERWSCKIDTVAWPPWGGWKVTIKDCKNRILDWCGRKYSLIGPTKCGHIEIEVPPGCYVVSAISGATGSNTFTAPAFVIVGCDETVCVNLLAPIQNSCGWYTVAGIKQVMRDGVVPEEVGNKAIDALKEVMKYTKVPQVRSEEPTLEEEVNEVERFLEEGMKTVEERKKK